MDEPQALRKFCRPEFFGGEKNFGGVETKFRVIAGRHRPFALAAGEKLGSKTDQRFDPRFLGNLDDIVDFGELLDDENDLLPQLSPEEGESDVIVIFVAVADD